MTSLESGSVHNKFVIRFFWRFAWMGGAEAGRGEWNMDSYQNVINERMNH